MVRGVDAAVLRTSMGSSVQLPTYNWTKNQLVSRGILPGDSVWTFLASSSMSGVCVVRLLQRTNVKRETYSSVAHSDAAG